jgi:hypothetical protein
MNIEEFIKYIELIGFRYISYDHYIYKYKEIKLDLYSDSYDSYYFWNGSDWIYDIPLNDLKPINEYFKKELRCIKLKALLGDPGLI